MSPLLKYIASAWMLTVCFEPIRAQTGTIIEENVIFDFSEFRQCYKRSVDTIDVIYLYTSWCGPCRKTLPSLRAFKNDFSAYPIRWWLISADEIEDNWTLILRQTRCQWNNVWIPDAEARQWFSENIQPYKAFPTIYLSDPIEKHAYATHQLDELRSKLEKRFKN